MFDIIVTSTFGLEAVCKRELEALGYKDLKVENGRITLKGDMRDVYRINLWIRSGERVLIKLAEFKAESFEELFNQVYAIDWPSIIERDGNFIVNGRCYKSKLFSISDSQRITEKAIVEKLKTVHKIDWFPKSGPRYSLEVSILNDIATISLDSSGAGLHKRGYRKKQGEAPIKETLAAAMVQLSYWRPDRLLVDPFCGSATILIEAGLIGKNIAPGLYRSFDCQYWKIFDDKIRIEERDKALKEIRDEKLRLIGYDIDGDLLIQAEENVKRAKLEDSISLYQRNFRDFDEDEEFGIIITNPPYGERINKEDYRSIYREMGNKFKKLDTWSIYVITSVEDFEKLYKKPADRKRKLYNGMIKVDYYQYYGPRPRKKENLS